MYVSVSVSVSVCLCVFTSVYACLCVLTCAGVCVRGCVMSMRVSIYIYTRLSRAKTVLFFYAFRGGDKKEEKEDKK